MKNDFETTRLPKWEKIMKDLATTWSKAQKNDSTIETNSYNLIPQDNIKHMKDTNPLLRQSGVISV